MKPSSYCTRKQSKLFDANYWVHLDFKLRRCNQLLCMLKDHFASTWVIIFKQCLLIPKKNIEIWIVFFFMEITRCWLLEIVWHGPYNHPFKEGVCIIHPVFELRRCNQLLCMLKDHVGSTWDICQTLSYNPPRKIWKCEWLFFMGIARNWLPVNCLVWNGPYIILSKKEFLSFSKSCKCAIKNDWTFHQLMLYHSVL